MPACFALVARRRVGRMALAALCLGVSAAAPRAQSTGVLAVQVSVGSGQGAAGTGRRHPLLVSDNPPSRAPWRVVTALDGTGKLTLPAGSYTIESEEPLIAQGKAYEWRQTVDVTAGSTTTIVLNDANAEIGTPAPAEPGAPASPRTDQWDLLIRWQESVVAIWTPTTHASAVVISPAGLLATTERVAGTARQLEVQLSPSRKFAARVVAADQRRNVAILQLDPAALAERPPLPLGCGEPRPALERGVYVSAIGTPARRQPTTTRGLLNRVDALTLGTWFEFAPDSAGGPVFDADGALLGLSSIAGGLGSDDTPVTSVVRSDAVCEVLAEAQRTLTAPPPATPLPVEPELVIDESVLREGLQRRAGSLTPPRVTTSGFDIELIPPVLAYAGLQESLDFGQWSAYVSERPAVLLVRVAPRQVESLWMKVARGAAMTQGVALPPITHHEPGFARLRVLCGGRELTPIHPFIVERRISETAAIREGLYVYAADAIGPHCEPLAFEAFSEKTPQKAETASVPPAIVDRIWRDLEPFRRPNAAR